MPALWRFLRTPKGSLLAIFLVMAPVAGLGPGLRTVLPGLAWATASAAALDLFLLRWKRRRWEIPSGALLTGLIVAMVLTPHEPWYVEVVTACGGVAAKYVFRTRLANVFNPAALGIVATFYLFHTGQSWWGALGELPPWALVLLFAGGVFIVDRVNKFPLLLAFLASFYLLASAAAFLGDPRDVLELFRFPDAPAVLFFAFFILTDPPTSPAQYRDQAIFGVLTAAVAFGFFEWVGAACYLLAGVLVANLWESWRRSRRARRSPFRLPAWLAPAAWTEGYRGRGDMA